jgi:hypothetical protein
MSPLLTAIFPILISSIMRESTLVIAWEKSLIVKCNASLRYPPSERDCKPCSKGGNGSAERRDRSRRWREGSGGAVVGRGGG